MNSINAERAAILSQRRGVRQKNLSLEKIKGISLWMPGKSKQEELVGRLDDVDAEICRLETTYQRKLAALHELEQSLLHEAFSGKL